LIVHSDQRSLLVAAAQKTVDPRLRVAPDIPQQPSRVDKHGGSQKEQQRTHFACFSMRRRIAQPSNFQRRQRKLNLANPGQAIKLANQRIGHIVKLNKALWKLELQLAIQ
jgi:hypothetical protein